MLSSVADDNRERLSLLASALRVTNRRLWLAEGRLRELTWTADGKEEYWSLSRALFFANSRRSSIKNEIDLLVGEEGLDRKHYNRPASSSGRLILDPPQSAILFDLDGVLVDTEPIKARAHAIIAEQIGVKDAPSYSALIGQPLTSIAELMTSAAGAGLDSTDYISRFHSVYSGLLARAVPPIAGGPEIVRQLRRRCLLTAVVTSSTLLECERALESAGYQPSAFDVIITSDDVALTKPQPEPYVAAMEALMVDPANCVAIEDSITGLTAASAADVKTVLYLGEAPDLSNRIDSLDELAQAPIFQNSALLDLP